MKLFPESRNILEYYQLQIRAIPMEKKFTA